MVPLRSSYLAILQDMLYDYKRLIAMGICGILIVILITGMYLFFSCKS